MRRIKKLLIKFINSVYGFFRILAEEPTVPLMAEIKKIKKPIVRRTRKPIKRKTPILKRKNEQK